jgi:hypothetical protein
MRAGILTLLLFFAEKTDTAAIEEDFGKFIKSARPFRPSENAKISDLAKGKKQREEFRDEECFTGFFLTSTCSNGLRRILLARAGSADGGHTWVNIYRKYSLTADVPLY